MFTKSSGKSAADFFLGNVLPWILIAVIWSLTLMCMAKHPRHRSDRIVSGRIINLQTRPIVKVSPKRV